MTNVPLEMLIATLSARPPVSGLGIDDMRATLEASGSMFGLAPDTRPTPVVAGPVRGEWISGPGLAEDRAILYLHGGGYALGSPSSHRHLVSRIARAAGVRALSLDYRRAPEHPFPAAVEDAVAACRWLTGTGLAAPRVVLAGDSAGGGLAVATLVALRQAGDPLPAGAVCLSPWVDLEGTGASLQSNAARDPIITAEGLHRLAQAYAGTASRRDPLISPIHADLSGLPPLLIQVGTAETLLDDALRLAERARGAGVDVTCEPWPDMLHVWQFFAPMLPEGQQAIDRVGAFIRQRLRMAAEG